LHVTYNKEAVYRWRSKHREKYLLYLSDYRDDHRNAFIKYRKKYRHIHNMDLGSVITDKIAQEKDDAKLLEMLESEIKRLHLR
jgi:hypothetical protein